MDPLLVDIEGHQEFLLGNEAIVRGALEAGVAFASGYPGTPSSEITDSFARIARQRDIRFEYSVNEKIALEMAFAASLAGARSICAMKHLGLMYAGDPISTIPYVGVSAGMVIVSAGDPSCRTSPNEQDQRHLGKMLHLPILDPSTPQEAHAMTRMAFELSETSRLPVLLRITTRIAHSRAAIRYGKLVAAKVKGFVRDPQRFVPIPANARRMRLEIPARLESARQWMSEAGLFRRSGEGKQAILASGAPAATCEDILREYAAEGRVVLARMGGVYPLPEAELRQLLAEVERALVVEELSPYLEDAVRALCAQHDLHTEILGKRTGHFPEAFEYEPAVIRRGLHSALGLGSSPVAAASFAPVTPRPPTLCTACPHRSTYFAARAAFGEEHLYFNDIGCYTLGYGDPLNTVDALLCMGAGFTLAAGVSRVTGNRTVGFLGDSTFFHSGMPALLNATKEDVNMVAVILDNQVTGMTGFQESPTITVEQGRPKRRVSIEGIVRALGVEQVETVDPSDLAATITAFERARDASGVSVLIAEKACPVFLDRVTGAPGAVATPYRIDHSRCQVCGREPCGLRCSQSTTVGLQRHMARARALEVCTAKTPEQETGRFPVAPCAMECPLGLCVQGYIGHIAAGQYRQALELIMSRCPLPDSVCRVCHRPCEPKCVLAGDDQPVAINDLKRFVMDWAAEREENSYDPPREPDAAKKVAVVGAGPAGLAAAHDLRLRGYDVTLYDAADDPGGLLRSAIPEFRLPREAVQRDVARILGLGVKFVGGTVLGRDLHLDELLRDGHDAVFLALGAHRALGLGFGEDGLVETPHVVDALAYLSAARNGDPMTTHPRVAVVGGGNAAIDAARTARRLGAQKVVVAYRRRRHEMPALEHEVGEAETEGIDLRTQLQPVHLVQGDPGGLLCRRTEPGPSDASGRQSPVLVPCSEVLLEADQVIVAIGQSPETDLLRVHDLPLERRPDGCLVVDPETAQTSHPSIFAGGDVAPGERTVTGAIAQGQRAAWGIDRILRGQAVADRRPPPPRWEMWPRPPEGHIPVSDRIDRTHRQRARELPIERRTVSFEESIGTLTEDQARAEAARCAVCGQCGNCRACIDLFGCPAFHIDDEGRVQIDPSLCSGCGVCVQFCPSGAIVPLEEGGS